MFDFSNPDTRNSLMRFGGNALSDLGYGLANSTNLGNAFGVAASRGAQMQPYRDQQFQLGQEKQQEQQVKNATLEWLRSNGYDDLVAGVEGGGLDIGTAWGEALNRSRPQGPQAPIKVGAGETLLDPTTFQPVYQGAPDPKEQFGYEKDLAAQYSGQDAPKTYQAVRNGYERVRASAEANSGPGDISMIFAYMKMLDPTSVVREGEFATAENAGGVGAQVTNLYNRMLSGERLTPELRQQFLAAADQLYAETRSNLSDINKQYEGRATAWGVDPTRFLIAPETYEPLQHPGSRTTSTGVNWSM